jgi:hypothetical protein
MGVKAYYNPEQIARPIEWSNGTRRARAIADSMHDPRRTVPGASCRLRGAPHRRGPRTVRKGDCRSFRVLVLARCRPRTLSQLV